jgi:ABC-type multidrug transport system ATPase subunit
MNRIQIENLSKSFAAVYALRNFSLTIEAGTAQSIVGPNGSGKSTLLRCVAGLERPDSGRVSIGQWDIARANDYRACKNECGIGFLGRTNGLYRDFSVRDNLNLAAKLKPKRSNISIVESVLDEMDLGEFAEKKISACSQGIARRSGLARLLVVRPKVLILDEPLANLDSTACDISIAALKRLLSEGCTMLIATHNPKLRDSFLTKHVELPLKGRIAAEAHDSSWE